MPHLSSARINRTVPTLAASAAASASRGATRRKAFLAEMNPHRSADDARSESAVTASRPSPHIHRTAARVHPSPSRLGTTSRRRKSFTSGGRLAGRGASASAVLGSAAAAFTRDSDAFAVEDPPSIAPKPAKASIDIMPSSLAPPPATTPASFRADPTRVNGAPVSTEGFEVLASAGANLATVTASDRSPSLRHTSAAASACCPASTKNAAANEYLCLDMSAYAFFSAASLCLSSAKFLDKNSASLVSRDALKSPDRTLVLPRAAYSSAQGFSPPGSRVAANSARAAASTSRRSSPVSLSHSGAPRRLRSFHDLSFDSSFKTEDRSASCVSHCSAHASSTPRGPYASSRPSSR